MFVFFFQAEDGIRDVAVTGVQTCALPICGAVPFDPAKSFALKPLPVRFLIVFAGPGMNFVLAALIFGVVLATIGRPVWPPVVGRVTDGSPAAAAGLLTDDVVTRVDGRPIGYWEDLDRAVAGSDGRTLVLTVRRGGAERTFSVTPRRTTVRDPIFRDPKDAWELGVGPKLTPQIGAVNPGSPAETAGLRVGDWVLAVAGQAVFTPDELMQAIQKRGGQTFDIVAERDGKPETLTVTATAVRGERATGEEGGNGRLGGGIR